MDALLFWKTTFDPARKLISVMQNVCFKTTYLHLIGYFLWFDWWNSLICFARMAIIYVKLVLKVNSDFRKRLFLLFPQEKKNKIVQFLKY